MTGFDEELVLRREVILVDSHSGHDQEDRREESDQEDLEVRMRGESSPKVESEKEEHDDEVEAGHEAQVAFLRVRGWGTFSEMSLRESM